MTLRWRGARLSPRDVQPFGDRALRFSAPGARAATALAQEVRDRRPAGLVEAVGGAESVLVVFDPDATSFAALADEVRSLTARPARSPGVAHTVAVSFDGPDVDEVHRLTGLDARALRRALLGCTLRVAFLGFAPGFAYLDGLPRPLDRLPRRTTPRAVVPAGSLAVGGGRAAIYPRATPGGWHIVGRTAVALFDAERPPYALLAPGDEVRLREVAPDQISFAPEPRPAPETAGPAVFAVEGPGLYSTFQDRGRAGLAHLGVSGSGAADRVSFALANSLLGNGTDAACLELTGTGPTLLCRLSTFVTVVGGQPEVLLDGRPVGAGRVVPVAAGQRLVIGSTGWSMRSYLAVRGGFDVEPVLSSRSTDRLGGLGPAPLGEGDHLVAGSAVRPMADHLVPGAPGQDHPGDPVTLRALPIGPDCPSGPRLFEGEFQVDATSDRVGVRLRPTGAGLDTDRVEAPSAGITAGAVQVPPSGQPIVLSADHATHGGYPVVAVVISADLPVVGRVRPGDRIRLVPADLDQALDALRSLSRGVEAGPTGTYPTAVG